MGQNDLYLRFQFDENNSINVERNIKLQNDMADQHAIIQNTPTMWREVFQCKQYLPCGKASSIMLFDRESRWN